MEVPKMNNKKAMVERNMKQIEEATRPILKLPEWMQKIVLDDIKTAIKNRIAIMEMISRKVTGRAA
jgi:hypothetical protein